MLRPKYQIQNAIKAYLAGDFGQAHSHNNNFKACDQNLLVRLKPKDKVFCSAYNSFIGKLLDANWDEELACENKVYHLGESHCLSYAHRNIAIGGSNFRIVPRITFGAKAFHFCRTKHDRFQGNYEGSFLSSSQRIPRFSYLMVKLTAVQTKVSYLQLENLINHWKSLLIRRQKAMFNGFWIRTQIKDTAYIL